MIKIHEYLDIAGPLAALPFFVLYKGLKDLPYRLLLFFILAELVTNVTAKCLMLAGPSNIRVYQANAFLTFMAAGGWFLHTFKKTMPLKWQRPLQWFFAAAVLLLAAILIFEDTSVLNSLSYTFASFVICTCCMLFYLFSMSAYVGGGLSGSFNFKVVTGFFVYYTTNFFIFFAYGLFTRLVLENFGVLWGIHNFILFSSCIIFALAIKQRKT